MLAASCEKAPLSPSQASPSATSPVSGSSVVERSVGVAVLFADPVGRTLVAYSGAEWEFEILPGSQFTGDATTFDEVVELERAGYQLSASVTYLGTETNGQHVDALRVTTTKSSLGPRTTGATMRVAVSPSSYVKYGIPSYTSTTVKWTSFVPPYVAVRADSEFHSVAEILAALAASDRVCVYEDGTITSTYATLVRVIGAWQMPDKSTQSSNACEKK